MDNRLREIILNIVLEELESNTSPTGDLESFKEIILNDFGIEAGEDAFNFYIECHSLNPQGFYLVYKNELEFSPEFKAKYDLEADEEIITESKESKELIKENEEDKDSFKVQEIDREGNKLDQFANFATAEEAIAFAKTLKTPVEVIDTTLSESLKEEKVIWTNLDTLEEALSRDAMISELKAKGKNYNFNKYSDSQIYYMYQREMNKKVEKPSNKIEANDEYKEIKKCPQCNHQLTDGGQCPVCDFGDEEERSSHMLHLDEALFGRVDPEVFEFKIGDRVAERWNDGEFNVGTITDIKEEEGTQYLVQWDYSDGPDHEWLYGDYLTQWIEESLNEEVLNEGPINWINKLKAKKNDPTAAAAKANKKKDAELTKTINSLGAILTPSYKDDKNTFLVNKKWIPYRDFIQQANADKVKTAIEKIKTLDTWSDDLLNDQSIKALITAIDTVVKNIDGYIIRKGLQVFRPKELLYNSTNPSTYVIKDNYKAETLFSALKDRLANPQEEPDNNSNSDDNNDASDNNSDEVAANPDEVTANPNNVPTADENPSADIDASPEARVSDKTIQNTIKAANVFGMKVFGMQSGTVRELNADQLKNLSANTNMDKIWVGMDANSRVSLAELADQLKKQNIIESYDDSMEYEEYEDQELDEGMSKEEMDEVIALSKQIGIEDGKTMNRFIRDEQHSGESILDTLRRYTDSDDGDLEELNDDSWLPKTELSDEDIYDAADLYPSLKPYLK